MYPYDIHKLLESWEQSPGTFRNATTLCFRSILIVREDMVINLFLPKTRIRIPAEGYKKKTTVYIKKYKKCMYVSHTYIKINLSSPL